MPALTPRVAVIGGGLAGLLTALQLARSGAAVTLFERRSDLGGRAASLDQDGYRLNLGPHALYHRGALARTLDRLGIGWSGPTNPVTPQLWSHGRGFTLPASPWRLLTTEALDWGGRWELARTMAGIRSQDPRAWDHTPTSEWLSGFSSASARRVLAALARLATYSADLDRLAAGVAIRQLALALDGVHYVDGGWQALVDRLVEACRGAGVHLSIGTPVDAIGPDRVVVGRPHDHVVVATSPAVARRLLPDLDLDLDPPVLAACLDLGLDRLPRPDPRGAIGLDQPLYAIVHSDARDLAPDGGVLLSCALYGGAHDAERRLEDFVDQVQPGWRQHLRTRRFLPGLRVVQALPSARTGGLPGRPAVAVAGRPGIWLAGDWVGPAGYLADGAAASASSVARGIMGASSRAAA